MILITKDKCNSCDLVKHRVNLSESDVQTYDVESVDAMVELCYLGLYGQPLSMPVLIDGKKYISGDVIGIVKHIQERHQSTNGSAIGL